MQLAATPDPAKGVFETLLAVDGRPVELDAHLARLAASLHALFGATLSERGRDLLTAKAVNLRVGRLRLRAIPREKDRIELDAHGGAVDPSTLFPSAAQAVAVRSLVVPGGLGPHKWVDRAPLDNGEGETTSVRLLLDGDGAVLEGSRANVFAAYGSTLNTPPADERILPGITRAIAIQLARAKGLEVREARLTRDGLREADEVFLTGAVRGIEPVGSIDGVEVHPAGELTRLLAGELRHRWLGRD